MVMMGRQGDISFNRQALQDKIAAFPQSPGVYLMKNADGDILYVGKAANLRNRVRSYFTAGQRLTPKLQRMVSRVNDFDLFITTSEQEALILELKWDLQIRYSLDRTSELWKTSRH